MWRSPSAHLDHVGLVPHATDLRHVPHLLLDQGGLERYQHEQREDTVVPVLVQAPQPHTEHLQRGGGSSMDYRKSLYSQPSSGLQTAL